MSDLLNDLKLLFKNELNKDSILISVLDLDQIKRDIIYLIINSYRLEGFNKIIEFRIIYKPVNQTEEEKFINLISKLISGNIYPCPVDKNTEVKILENNTERILYTYLSFRGE